MPQLLIIPSGVQVQQHSDLVLDYFYCAYVDYIIGRFFGEQKTRTQGSKTKHLLVVIVVTFREGLENV